VEDSKDIGHKHATDCRAALAQLYAYIDGELDSVDRDAFQAHLEACRPCLSYYEFERFFTQFVKRHAPQPCVRAEFKASLMARLSDERRLLDPAIGGPVQTPASRFAFFMPRFALAAVVVLAVGVASWWMGHRSSDGVNWPLLAGYHQGMSEVEGDGLDTTDFSAARAFLVSRLGSSIEDVLPRRMPAGLVCEAACVLPWGSDRLAQFEWLHGSERISMFIVPIDTMELVMEPEHRPRIAFEDRDYHMLNSDGVKGLCWRVGPKDCIEASPKSHIFVVMGAASFDTILAWAESIRHGDSLSPGNPGAAPGTGIGN
jgi:anti-sigma factor (TIGR02949 family)